MKAIFVWLGSWCTAHIRSGKWVHGTQLEVTMYSKYTANISSNLSHFLTAVFLVYCTYKVRPTGDYRTKVEVAMLSKYTACMS